MDINLEEMRPEWDRCERYEDRSIFKYPGKFKDYEEGLRNQLQQEDDAANKIAFPEKDLKSIIVLKDLEGSNQKVFHVYSVQ